MKGSRVFFLGIRFWRNCLWDEIKGELFLESRKNISLCATARFICSWPSLWSFLFLLHLSHLARAPPEGEKEDERKDVLWLNYRIFWPLPTIGLSLTLLRSTQAVCPLPSPHLPHLSPLGHFMPNCSQGKRGEGRRGGTERRRRRRKIFSPTLLPPSAADYRGKLFMCALSSSSSSLRSQAATKTNAPKASKQVHILVGLCG